MVSPDWASCMSGAPDILRSLSELTRGRSRSQLSEARALPLGAREMERLAEGLDPRVRDFPMRYPPTAPAAAPKTALVQTFRSLLIASSKALNPAHSPTPNPAPAPAIVQVNVARLVLVDWV